MTLEFNPKVKNKQPLDERRPQEQPLDGTVPIEISLGSFKAPLDPNKSEKKTTKPEKPADKNKNS